MEHVVSFELPTVIMGDFNLDLSSSHLQGITGNFVRTMESFFFTQCIDTPTRVTERNATLLDHMWINCEDLLINSGTLTGLSDHKMIKGIFNIKIKHEKKETFTCRSYRGFNQEKYLEDLSKVDWTLPGDDIERTWQVWKSKFLNVLNSHTRIITYKKGKQNTQKPWINSNVLELVWKKHAAEVTKEYRPTTVNMESWRKAKHESDKECFKAKQAYYHDKIEENISNPRKIWKIIKDIAPATLKSKTLKECALPADEFADFFTRVDNLDVSPANTAEINHDLNGFQLTKCTEEEVLKIVKNLATNKAEGIDGIPSKAIKLGITKLLKPLTDLINNFIVAGFPRELKTAIVLPIHKKGPTDMLDNYRPISLLPCVSKIAERVIVDQLNSHLTTNKLISKSQHGFRQMHSTNTGLLQITEYIRKELDQGKAIGLVALDLSKAFDTIDHRILIRKLPSFNLGPNTIAFLNNYLSDRALMVRTGKENSKLCSVSRGVPQGSILGPLLFTLYINDVPNLITNSQAMLYADDTTLYTSSKFPANIQVTLNNDIKILENWFKENKLKINASKTEYMLVSNNRTRKRFDQIKIKVDNQILLEKEVVKILGINISNDLSWENHTRKLIGTMRHYYRSFSRSCKVLTKDSKRLLYNSAIASRLNYGDIVWDRCGVDSVNKLQTVQNRCARRINEAMPWSHALPHIRSLGWITLDMKRKLHKCVMLHELLYERGPEILIDELKPYTNRHARTTRRAANEELNIIAHNTDYVTKSFYYDTAKVWNEIPLHIRLIQQRSSFKEQLHKHFLSLTR